MKRERVSSLLDTIETTRFSKIGFSLRATRDSVKTEVAKK